MKILILACCLIAILGFSYIGFISMGDQKRYINFTPMHQYITIQCFASVLHLISFVLLFLKRNSYLIVFQYITLMIWVLVYMFGVCLFTIGLVQNLTGIPKNLSMLFMFCFIGIFFLLVCFIKYVYWWQLGDQRRNYYTRQPIQGQNFNPVEENMQQNMQNRGDLEYSEEPMIEQVQSINIVASQ